jgi:hypothetical protein
MAFPMWFHPRTHALRPLESYRPRVWREADNHTDLFNDPVESKPHDLVPVERRLAVI